CLLPGELPVGPVAAGGIRAAAVGVAAAGVDAAEAALADEADLGESGLGRLVVGPAAFELCLELCLGKTQLGHREVSYFSSWRTRTLAGWRRSATWSGSWHPRWRPDATWARSNASRSDVAGGRFAWRCSPISTPGGRATSARPSPSSAWTGRCCSPTSELAPGLWWSSA